MTRHSPRLVTLLGKDDAPALSKGQKTFNGLVKKIDAKRTQLLAWEEAILGFHKTYASDMKPLLDTYVEKQVAMVQCLDRASQQMALNKNERSMLSEIVTDLAGSLIAENDRGELKEIYNAHSRSDYDREEADELQLLKSSLETNLNVDLGNEEFESHEELLQRAHAQLGKRQQEFDDARQARQAKRKKTAKQLAKEAALEAEEKEINLSIREVYRKLASALHPDRETDAAERERKTSLMQRANQAYERRNLLQLLELQLELEHIDLATIKNLSDERLTHYNKILKGQLAELEHELIRIEQGFRMQFGIDPFVNLSPNSLLRHLKNDMQQLQATIQDMDCDLAAFAEVKKLKQWLKGFRRQSTQREFDTFPF